MYCSRCGEEIRIVPDYEPEIFIELSESISSIAESYELDSTGPEGGPAPSDPVPVPEAVAFGNEPFPEEGDSGFRDDTFLPRFLSRLKGEDKVKEVRQRKRAPRIRMAGILIAGTAFVALFLTAIFKFNRYFDYDIQYADALALHDEGRYEESLNIARHALSINNSEDKTRFLIADDYYELGKYDESNAVLFSMLSDREAEKSPVSSGDINIYDRIIKNYRELKDYDTIVSILSDSEDEELISRYSVYFAEAPVFSKKGGDYEKDIKLSLSASAPGVIYYTTDGTEPDSTSKVYKAPLDIREGEMTVSALFVNEYGISSPVASQTYTVDYPVARPPKLLVSSGTYEIPCLIRVEYPENYRVFYTTDGKDPDETSKEYKKPLEMPLGSSEFRFVAIDERGRRSVVVSGEYRLKMVCYIDLETALNALKIQLMSKGENSLLNEYKCGYAYGYGNNSFYLIDEYTYSGSRTGRRFAVDTKTGSIFEASWSSDKQDYSLSVI